MNESNSKNWYYEVLEDGFNGTGFEYPYNKIFVNTDTTSTCFVFDKETGKEVAQISYDLRGCTLFHLRDYYIQEGYDSKEVLQWFNNQKHLDGLLIAFSDFDNDKDLLALGCVQKAYVDDNYGYLYAFSSDLKIDEDDLNTFR